jgi:8-oxo-dGTP diphosphatase
LLLGQRKNTAGDGAWGLPGGHLELGEAMEDTAARELKEETGLSAEGFSFANLVNDKAQDKHYVQVGIVADGVVGEPELREPELCYAWEWFDLENLPELFFGHAEQIKIFKEGRQFSDT